MPVNGQLSLFGVEATDPVAADLEGLLAGAGQVVRLGGTARVSIVVDDLWRANALEVEFALRGLGCTIVPTIEQRYGVRTAYSSSLAPLASGWLRGAVKVPPRGFSLDGPRLRFWVIAGGRRDSAGFLLPLGPHDEAAWAPVGAALASTGLPGVLLGPRAGGPAYRLVGRRRLARLVEMIGQRPVIVPESGWPEPV
jgi:hypothetical protein